MFFRNSLIYLFLKFFWIGLILGLFLIVCGLVIKASRKNVYIYNIISFCYCLLFGGIFTYLCIKYYNFSFCWFGLLGMFLGLGLTKISINFFFTKLAKLLYNKFKNVSERKKENVRLRTNEKT